MAHDVYHQIIDLVLKASKLAQAIGISNLFQPGLVKEIIIADILEHQLIHSKRDQMLVPTRTLMKSMSTSPAKRVAAVSLTVCLATLRTNARNLWPESQGIQRYISPYSTQTIRPNAT